MKLLFAFVLLALFCMVRSAPPSSSPSRQLIFSNYDDDKEVGVHDDDTHLDVEEEEDDDEDETTTTTTTTTTTRRSTFVFPTRNRNLIPSRRPPLTQRTSSIRTTTNAFDFDDQDDTTIEYDGDFKYIRDFRKYFEQLLQDIKKLVRKITGYDFDASKQKQHYTQDDD